jgi:hypothetical protein
MNREGVLLADNPSGGISMTLQFPNHSRSYDRTRQAVRFWGYDTSIEYSFFVTVDALARVEPRLRRDEEGFLGAFDANRDLILPDGRRGALAGSKEPLRIGWCGFQIVPQDRTASRTAAERSSFIVGITIIATRYEYRCKDNDLGTEAICPVTI